MQNNKIVVNEAKGFASEEEALKWVESKYPNYSPARQKAFAKNIFAKQQREIPNANDTSINQAPKASLRGYGNNTDKSQQLTSDDVGKPEIDVNYEVTSKGNIKLTFWGINPSAVPALKEKLLKPNGFPQEGFGIVSLTLRNYDKGCVMNIFIHPDEKNLFLDKGLNAIQFVLLKSGAHSTEAVMQLTDAVGFKMETMTPDEEQEFFKKGEMSEIKMWQTYISRINDPEIREALKIYSQIYGNTVYGYALGLGNVIRIKHIDPNATFVLGPKTWRMYGRGIKKNAKRFPCTGFAVNGEPTTDEIKKAISALGHDDAKFEDLGVEVQHAVKIEASKRKNGYSYNYIGYDIADTYLFDQTKDPLNSKPNISSNIVYSLNKLAQMIEDRKKAESGEEPIEGEDLMQKRTSVALSELYNLCKEKNIHITPNTNASDSAALVDTLLSIYSSMATQKANVLTASNINKVAEDCTHLTLVMDGLALDQLNRFHHPNDYTEKDMQALAPLLKHVIGRIGKATATINEINNEDNFLTRLKNAMKQIGMKIIDQNDDIENNVSTNEPLNTKETITETFNKWFDRIQKSDILKPTRICD